MKKSIPHLFANLTANAEDVHDAGQVALDAFKCLCVRRTRLFG
jgi:hypothetical protein